MAARAILSRMLTTRMPVASRPAVLLQAGKQLAMRSTPVTRIAALPRATMSLQRCFFATGGNGGKKAEVVSSSSSSDEEEEEEEEEDEYFEDDDFDGEEEREEELISYPEPIAKVGNFAPLFSADGIVGGKIGKIHLADYLDAGKWVVLFFYPKDFTFVCPTEITAFNDRAGEFAKANAVVVGASIDTPEVHLAWTRTPRKKGGLGQTSIPLVSDVTKNISNQYGVLNTDLGIAYRGLFIINPDGVIEHMSINNFPVGRSVDETLRLVQAFQFTAEHGEVCPINWKPGSKTMVADPDKSLEYFATVNEGPAGGKK